MQLPYPHLAPFSPFSLVAPLYTGNDQYPTQSAQNQASHGVPNLVDGSGPIFSMYLEMAEEEDKKIAEHWQANGEVILIFVGLYPLVPCFTPTH